ncbi:MAG: gas vesicle protein K [Isosphaeraceae bacterium]|jgi:Gas vesicle protein K
MEPIGTMTAATNTFDAVADALAAPMPSGLRVAIRPDDVRNGLGKLVLTLVELIRQLLERQAIRRIEAGSLDDDEIERLGITFLQLGEQVTLLRKLFGLDDEDLNLDLGPLGKLL